MRGGLTLAAYTTGRQAIGTYIAAGVWWLALWPCGSLLCAALTLCSMCHSVYPLCEDMAGSVARVINEGGTTFWNTANIVGRDMCYPADGIQLLGGGWGLCVCVLCNGSVLVSRCARADAFLPDDEVQSGGCQCCGAAVSTDAQTKKVDMLATVLIPTQHI